MFRYLNDNQEQLQTSIVFDILIRIEDGGNEALETIVRLNFISSSYDWVVNTSVVDVTSNPVTTNPTDITGSSVISPVDNHETETIDTTSQSQIGSTIEPTTVPITSHIQYNLTDDLLSQASGELDEFDNSINIFESHSR